VGHLFISIAIGIPDHHPHPWIRPTSNVVQEREGRVYGRVRYHCQACVKAAWADDEALAPLADPSHPNMSCGCSSWLTLAREHEDGNIGFVQIYKHKTDDHA
jgi:hypothetical protein